MEALSSQSTSSDPKTYLLNHNLYNTDVFDINVMAEVETAVIILNFEEENSAKFQEQMLHLELINVKSENPIREMEPSCNYKTKTNTSVAENMTVLPPKKKRGIVLNTKCKKKPKKTKLKKPKKWQNVDNTEFGFNLTLFPRPSKTAEFEGNIDNLLSEIEKEFTIFEKRSANFETVLDYEGDRAKCRHLRKNRHRRIQKAHKQVKTKYCRNISNNKGRKTLYVKHRVLARIKLDPQRTYLHYPSLKPKQLKFNKSDENSKSSSNSDFTWQKTNQTAPVQNLTYALDTNNYAGFYEANVLSLLINLQHRDLTPEDYEILSTLDQSVAPKTVSECKIASFKMEEVSDSMLDKLCSVCLEPYKLGQICKYLPCGHEFHNNCIDMWLSNSSMNCPLDGLPVDD